MRLGWVRQTRGISLVEVIFFVAIMTTVAVFTMRSLGQARAVRARAADRAQMALAAQTELDRVRRIPAPELNDGSTTQSLPQLGEASQMVTSLARRDDGNWGVEVSVMLDTIEGNAPVQLSTIRQGSGS